MAHSVFISYRRADTKGYAMWLFGHLRQWFDADELFFDQSSIDIGEQFPSSIQSGIDAAKVVLIVIGPEWLATLNKRALEPGVDYVSEEVAQALSRFAQSNAPQVIPLLMGDTSMPDADQIHASLIDKLSGLLSHNALEFKGTQPDFDSQFKRLHLRLGEIDGVPSPRFRTPEDAHTMRFFPYSRNHHFTGRDIELTKLHEALSTRSGAALTALSGLGGVGKTQLALEYSYQYAEDYAGIWWIRSETSETIARDMQVLATRLGIAQAITEQSDLIAAVNAWLDQQSLPWLLVYDNAPGPSDIVPYLPTRREQHHIIVTSRHSGGWRGIAEPLPVTPLHRNDSINFLEERTGQNDRVEADNLANLLGDLPLALEQAGASIESMGLSIKQYAELFEQRSQTLLNRHSETADYPNSVATTWNIAFESVKEESLTAACLLNLLSFYAPDAIPYSIVTDGYDALPDTLSSAATDPLALFDAVSSLRKHSLIVVNKDEWYIHRLVQSVTRDALTEEALTWAETAANVIQISVSNDGTNPETWSTTSRLLPHVVAITDFAEHHGVALETTSWLLDKAGSYLTNVRAEFQQAEKMLNRALVIDQRVLGEEHPSTATSYNNVASNLNAQGRYEEAEPLYRQGLEIRQRVLGEEHPDTAGSYNNVAYNLNAQGRYEEAEPLYRQGLEISQRVLGEEHPSTAASYNNVASNLDDQGRYEEAEPLFRQGLEIRQRVLGEEHPDTAASYNNVASNLDDQGRYEEAEPLYRQGLEIRQRVLGEEHPSTAASYNNVASNLDDQGRYEEAEPLYRQGLEISQRVLGEEHPSTAASYNNVASNLNAQGRYEEAEPLFRQGLEIRQRVLGEEHPSTAASYNNVAYNLNAQGRYEEAEPLYRQGLEISQRVLGEEHPDTAASYNNVAYNLNAQGRYEEAEPLFSKALEILEAKLPDNHPHIDVVRSGLARNQFMMNK